MHLIEFKQSGPICNLDISVIASPLILLKCAFAVALKSRSLTKEGRFSHSQNTAQLNQMLNGDCYQAQKFDVHKSQEYSSHIPSAITI